MVVAAPVETLTFTRTIKAPAEYIYKSFTDRDWIYYWFSDDANVRAVEGGHALFTWFPNYHAFGLYKKLEANKHIVMDWRGLGETQDSEISIHIDEQNGTSTLNMEITGFDPEAAEEVSREWNTRLNNLVTVLEVGNDERLTKRVIIGIFPGAFDADVAKRVGVPVTEGTLVTDVIEGRPADRAGIRKDDVIVAMNGKAVTQNTPMNVLVADKAPGDDVEVTYYRGADKHTVKLQLIGYPIPDIYSTPAALGDAYEKDYATHGKNLAALLEGITEAEAAKRPAPEEWSVNEILAHLVLNERWLQHWIGGMLQAPEVQGYTCNHAARIAAVTSIHKTHAAILAELHRGWAETVALVRAMPDSITDRKTLLWWHSFEMDGMSRHTQTHLGQIKAALEAARA